MLADFLAYLAFIAVAPIFYLRLGLGARGFHRALARQFDLETEKKERSHWARPVDLVTSGPYRDRQLQVETLGDGPFVSIPVDVDDDLSFLPIRHSTFKLSAVVNTETMVNSSVLCSKPDCNCW